jgi:hypothetical protein
LPWLTTPENSRLANLTFLNCIIYGPAILVAESDCRFDRCWAKGSFEGAAWVLPTGHGGLVQGCIPARNLKFDTCWFYGVGFAAAAKHMKELAEDIGWMFEGSPHLKRPPRPDPYGPVTPPNRAVTRTVIAPRVIVGRVGVAAAGGRRAPHRPPFRPPRISGTDLGVRDPA